MSYRIFKVNNHKEYRSAGDDDLIELIPYKNANPLFIQKYILEDIVSSIAINDFIHLSGPTGSAKTSLIEALGNVPENYKSIYKGIDSPLLPKKIKPVQLFVIEIAQFETMSEIFKIRIMENGTTKDVLSPITEGLREAGNIRKDKQPLIWIRELGSVFTDRIQRGLLNIITKGDIVFPDNSRMSTEGISWIADSNYQDDEETTYTHVRLDEALKRRFSSPIKLGYLKPEMESAVLEHLTSKIPNVKSEPELLSSVVRLGQLIREYRKEGNLLSLVPPTIYGYMTFIMKANIFPHRNKMQIAMATLLGNASSEDSKLLPAILSEAFSFESDDEDAVLAANLF